MNALPLRPGGPARHLIDDAIAANGAMRVLWVAMLTVLRERPARRPRPPDVESLSSHMRADIGLHPEPEAIDWQRYLP